MKQLVFLLLFLGTAVADERQSVQTHDMYNNCKIAIRVLDGEKTTADEAILGGNCMGYMRGVADGLTVWLLSKGTHTFNTKVSTEALLRSFVNYVNAHPAEMDNTNIIVVLEDAWVADGIIIPKPVRQ